MPGQQPEPGAGPPQQAGPPLRTVFWYGMVAALGALTVFIAVVAVYAVRAEMARTLDDVLSRRTRLRLFARDASVDAAAPTAALLARELGWSDAERDREVASYLASVAAERTAEAS